jgi:hypothetical protein
MCLLRATAEGIARLPPLPAGSPRVRRPVEHATSTPPRTGESDGGQRWTGPASRARPRRRQVTRACGPGPARVASMPCCDFCLLLLQLSSGVVIIHATRASTVDPRPSPPQRTAASFAGSSRALSLTTQRCSCPSRGGESLSSKIALTSVGSDEIFFQEIFSVIAIEVEQAGRGCNSLTDAPL